MPSRTTNSARVLALIGTVSAVIGMGGTWVFGRHESYAVLMVIAAWLLGFSTQLSRASITNRKVFHSAFELTVWVGATALCVGVVLAIVVWP